MVNIQIDTKDFRKILAPLAIMGKEMDKAVFASMRRTLDSMRSDVTKEIRKSSYLKSSLIRQSIGKAKIERSAGHIKGSFRVNSKPHGMDSFRLTPKRITARKRKASRHWPLSGYQIGPGESMRQMPAKGDWSAAFVVRLQNDGRLLMVRRNSKGKLRRVYGYAVQYFAAFDATQRAVEQRARDMFEKRLRHEVTYRLGKLR